VTFAPSLRRPLPLVLVLGLIVGSVYALSPLTVWSAVMFAALVWKIGDGLPEAERRRVRWILAIAIAARVAAIGGLFLATDHARVPFGSFFGDEEYFIRRATWLRNVALGTPIHGADLIYAFDEYSYTHYLYVMAFLEALVGFAPYGLHMLSAAMYVGGTVILFRLARRAYGSGVALAGLIVLLFLPSLFAWSIAALKEPPYFLVGAATATAAIHAVATRSLGRRIVLAAFVVVAALALQAIREGGLLMAAVGVVGGVFVGWLAVRPWAAIAFAVLAPVVVVGALVTPSVQFHAVEQVRRAARLHWGHINTPGYVYKTLDDRLYAGKSEIDSMTRGETSRFLVRSALDYLTVPRPWTIQSTAALAFVPELMFWYSIIALAPVGFVAALRREPIVTGVLAASACAAAALVAVTSGNIGTLIRHRGLALPYLVWLSAAGADCLIVRFAGARAESSTISAGSR
jgi:hypothetical protein